MRVKGYSATAANVRAAGERARPLAAAAGQSSLQMTFPTDRVEQGDLFGIPEAERTDSVRKAIADLLQEVTDLQARLERAERRIAELEQEADRDPLLPIANRRAFVRELARARAFQERHGVPSCLVYLDINGMKRINDEHGHVAGDKALRLVADVLIENTRFTDTVGRLGGDEFGVILSHTDPDAGAEKARALVEAIAARPLELDGATLSISMAHGVAAIEGGDDESLEAADRAMYRRKLEMTGTPPR